MLTLSWSDGNTLIPVNSCLLASAKDTNIIGPVKTFDNRTVAGKRRKLAQTKAPEAMMILLDTALSTGMKAEYVLFDSWFSNPAQVTDIHSLKLSDEQLTAFTADFEARLPEYLRNALHPEIATA